MTSHSGGSRERMAALLEEAFDSGALAFSEPLLQAVEGDARDEFSGRVRSEHGISYEIERKLGRGGMATVYLARDPKHDRQIAIKVLHADISARVGAERFVREIRLTARLQHPHVLGLLDSGVFDENAGLLARRPYYAMPYVEGETLRARLARDGALPLGEAVRLLREVADALWYAHEAGVIHRDIKPENILLTRGHAIVADFGIAKAIAAAGSGSDARDEGSPIDLSNPSIGFTQASAALGTPAYMAPEQAAADARVDHRADLYAWGVVAHETLTGRHPLRGPPGAADLPSAPSIPGALATLVRRCLERAPGGRPRSAAEVLAALDSVAIDERSAGTEPTSASTKSRRTRRAVMAALGIAIILLATSQYAWPRTMVLVGTDNPATDVAAVQAAVDHADTVELERSFSFRQPPTARVRPSLSSAKFAAPPAAQVLVSRAVTIMGIPDTLGAMATIHDGTIPFYIEAPGAHVAIKGVRFVRPLGSAIMVDAVRDLDIGANRVDGMVPFRHTGGAFVIKTSTEFPTPTDSGTPGDVSGFVSIHNNNVDVRGWSAGDYAVGLLVWSVGLSPKAEVTLDITGNTISNTSASAIMVRRANGPVHIAGNTVETSTGTVPDATAVRLANTGSYKMAGNTITCRWVNCVGILVFSQVEQWPITGAIVEDNRVNMLPPAGSVFADSSAAIEIKGFAHANVVRNNIISGRGRTGLAIGTWRLGYPADNAFIDNDLDAFHGAVANAFVGSLVSRTRLVHPGTVVDHGVGTTIER